MADATYMKQVVVGIVVGIAATAIIAFLRDDVLFGVSVGIATAVVVIAALAGPDEE